MKYLIIAIAAILFLAVDISRANSMDSDNKCEGLDKKVAALVSEYKELRERRRRLPQGTFDKDVSGYGGGLFKVMASLGVEFGRPPYTKKTVVACLGKPDAIRSHKQMRRFLDIYNRELRKAGREIKENAEREYLVYFWRGWHDFLFFITEDGVVVDHGWWFAYE